MKKKLRVLIAPLLVFVIYIPAVSGQANLTFSGGNGTPLTVTLQQAVSYTITNTQCDSNTGPIFTIDEAGNPLNGTRSAVGTITFSINGGAAQPITVVRSGTNFGNFTTNDLWVYGNLPNLANGSTVVLSAGTITTTSNVAAAPPANGNFTTFINGGTGVLCSTNGVAVIPTAASVSISGRVFASSKRGLSNASVYLTDSEGNTRTARTNSFGYYHFEDISAGQTVSLIVVSKRFQFAPRILNLNEEVTQLNFVAEN
jgi:hypothetical protein